jgi:hypothetical protein
MMHVKNELIQVEAAQALACIALGMYKIDFFSKKISIDFLRK